MLARLLRRLPSSSAQWRPHPFRASWRPAHFSRRPPVLPSSRGCRGFHSSRSARSPAGELRRVPIWQAMLIMLKRHPVQMSFALVGITLPIVLAIVFTYSYMTSEGARALHNLPVTVAKPLKKALYFSNIQKDPQRALRFYKEALFAAHEAGLHPLSDEVIGIKCQIALYFASIDHYTNAIEVVEKMRTSLLDWLDSEGDEHFDDGQRARILKRTVGQSVQLGEWYSMDWVGRWDDAEEALASAAEMVLKERERLRKLGLKEDEKFPLSDEEVGGALEALAQHYSAQDTPELATPLYLRALSLCEPNSCHAVVLMNNIATSIAEQPAPTKPPQDFIPQEEQARLWAEKAISVSERIVPPDRTDECATGCATAKANIAELLERKGQLQDAHRLFRDAEDLASSVGFTEGVEMASSGRKRVLQELRKRG